MILAKKAEKKATNHKEREQPAGLDGAEDVKGDEAYQHLSQGNKEALQVLAQRQNSTSKDKRKIDSAANAADPTERSAKRRRSVRCAPAAAAAAATAAAPAAAASSSSAPSRAASPPRAAAALAAAEVFEPLRDDDDMTDE